MSEQERDAVIDECIRAVLSLRDDPGDEDGHIETITGAACFRMMLLKARNAALRAEVESNDALA